MPKGVILKYVGKGAYLPGVPARDLTADDLVDIKQRLGYSKEQLLNTLLYQNVSKRVVHENKIVLPSEHKEKELDDGSLQIEEDSAW